MVMLDRIKNLLRTMFNEKRIGQHYLTRWTLVTISPLLDIFVHRYVGADPSPDLHDHPWLFNFTIVLKGEFLEQVDPLDRSVAVGTRWFRWRWLNSPHRIYNVEYGTVTLFVGFLRVREWGFYSGNGYNWISHNRYSR